MTKRPVQEPRMTVEPPRSAGGSGETMVETEAQRHGGPAATPTPAATTAPATKET